ncbi:MAG: hypothetical protein Q8Q09_07045, partial [Deltaproteobacteria bacterium]|nr:hypothetical protein [Deltaproteobacteria bacterium]
MREERTGPHARWTLRNGPCAMDPAHWALATLARAYVHGTYGELISRDTMGRAPAENAMDECGLDGPRCGVCTARPAPPSHRMQALRASIRRSVD